MAKRRQHDSWFSTTEAARLCGLSHMTVIRRFDAGDIKGFRVPGSRFRRIPKESLLEFAQKHGIPLPEEFRGDSTSAVLAKNKRRALIVEDDRRMADLLARILGADGWEVRTARNGFDAGFQAGSFLPELVLLDIMLPGLDGCEACKRMRADPRLVGAKILAVTGLKDQVSVNGIMDSGVDGYLAKPFAISDLREKISSMMPKTEGGRSL